MASGLLSLKWNHHRSTFLHVLANIRQKESYCDVTLACSGKFYSAHKLVLSTCSEYFEEMFERTQCKHPVIVLKDIGSEELEALLSYMYDGEVNVLQENLSSLIKAAECLKIKGLAVADRDPSELSKDNNKSSSSSSNNSNKDVNRSHNSSSYHNSDSRQFSSNNRGNSGVKRPIINKQEDVQPTKRRRPAESPSSGGGMSSPPQQQPPRRSSVDKSISKDRSLSSSSKSDDHQATDAGGDVGADDNNSTDAPGGADDQASSDVPEDGSRSFAQNLSEDTGVKAEPVEILDSDDMGYDHHGGGGGDAGASHDTSDQEFTEEKFSGGAGGADGSGSGDPNSIWAAGDPSDLFSQPSTSSFTGDNNPDNNSNNNTGNSNKAGSSSAGPMLFGDTTAPRNTTTTNNNNWLGIGFRDEDYNTLTLENNNSQRSSSISVPPNNSSVSITAIASNETSSLQQKGNSSDSSTALHVGNNGTHISSTSLTSQFHNPPVSIMSSSTTLHPCSSSATDDILSQHQHDESTSSSVTEFLGSFSHDILEVNFATTNSDDNLTTSGTSYNNYPEELQLQMHNFHQQNQFSHASPPKNDPFKCQQCPYTTNRITQFKTHMRGHSGEKIHYCPHCPYQTNIKCHLQRHMRKHTGERPYSCNVCGKSFFNSDYLIIHTRIHTGEKPFACQYCDYRSTQKGHMKAHVSNKHTDRLPFNY